MPFQAVSGSVRQHNIVKITTGIDLTLSIVHIDTGAGKLKRGASGKLTPQAFEEQTVQTERLSLKTNDSLLSPIR